MSSLYSLVQRIFEERMDVMVLPEESLTLQSLYSIGTSAGGKHPIAIIAIHYETHEIRSGQIDFGTDYTYPLCINIFKKKLFISRIKFVTLCWNSSS